MAWGARCSLRIFGIGFYPESIIAAFRTGVSASVAADLLVPDSLTALNADSGRLVPVTAALVSDAVSLLWLPTWAEQSQHFVILVDATMIGHGAFPIVYPHSFLEYAILQASFGSFGEEATEIFVFSLLHSNEPLKAEDRYPTQQATTLILQLDPLTPFGHVDYEQAFQEYRLWGRHVENIDAPPSDLDHPVIHVQVTYHGETRALYRRDGWNAATQAFRGS